MWLDHVMHWTKLNKYENIKELQKTDVNGEPVQEHVNLLFQKTTELMLMICSGSFHCKRNAMFPVIAVM